MWVALCRVEIHLPGSRSLKEKRKTLRHLIDRGHARWRLSIAEVDLHDLHQRAVLGVAAVGRSQLELARLTQRMRTLFDEQIESYVVNWDEEIQEYGP